MREQVAIVQPRDLWGLAARVVLLAAALGVGLWLLVTLRSIVLLILLAIIVAAGLGPLVDRLQRAGLPRALAVLLIYLGFILAILVLGVLVVPPIVRQAEQEVGHAPEYVDLATQWLRDLHSRFPFLPPLDQLSDQLQQQVGGLEG